MYMYVHSEPKLTPHRSYNYTRKFPTLPALPTIPISIIAYIISLSLSSTVVHGGPQSVGYRASSLCPSTSADDAGRLS